jgi:hypothetical protein
VGKVIWYRRQETLSVEEWELQENLKAWRESAGDPDYQDESLLAYCRQRRNPLGETFCHVQVESLLPGYLAKLAESNCALGSHGRTAHRNWRPSNP